MRCSLATVVPGTLRASCYAGTSTALRTYTAGHSCGSGYPAQLTLDGEDVNIER